MVKLKSLIFFSSSSHTESAPTDAKSRYTDVTSAYTAAKIASTENEKTTKMEHVIIGKFCYIWCICCIIILIMIKNQFFREQSKVFPYQCFYIIDEKLLPTWSKLLLVSNHMFPYTDLLNNCFYILMPKIREIIVYFRFKKCHVLSQMIALFALIPKLYGFYNFVCSKGDNRYFRFIEVHFWSQLICLWMHVTNLYMVVKFFSTK